MHGWRSHRFVGKKTKKNNKNTNNKQMNHMQGTSPRHPLPLPKHKTCPRCHARTIPCRKIQHLQKKKKKKFLGKTPITTPPGRLPGHFCHSRSRTLKTQQNKTERLLWAAPMFWYIADGAVYLKAREVGDARPADQVGDGFASILDRPHELLQVLQKRKKKKTENQKKRRNDRYGYETR